MLLIGSDDGIYRIDGIRQSNAEAIPAEDDTSRVFRLRSFRHIPGVFAATESGLYHSSDGLEWTNLHVPHERVYAIGARAKTLFAGTRPAHIFAADLSDYAPPYQEVSWSEINSFRDRPVRSEWKLPRHENLAQARDILVHPDRPNRITVGVEVGGVHLSNDSGDTWDKRGGAADDIHELSLAGPDEFIAATGFGLFRTTDAGESWTRLDTEYEQRYFRAVFVDGDGTVYAGGALKNSSTWDDDDAAPEFFRAHNGSNLEPIRHPRPTETVTGITAVDGTVVAATHRGTILANGHDSWEVVGSFPISEEPTGRYTPLLSFSP